jgi:uncharacterized protein
MTLRYPRVRPTPLDSPYWDGLRSHRLLLQQCRECATFQWYPRPICSACYSEELAWVELQPRGTIFSFTVTHQRVGFRFDEESPFAVAIVELTDAPKVRMAGLLRGINVADVRIGLPVRGEFRDIDGDEPTTILAFVPE